MRITDLFIRRPVLALVVSTLMVAWGLYALNRLPVRQYPLLENSTISVTTEYPGASAELMQGFITQPLAQALASVEGLDYMSSSSVQGRSVIELRMQLNHDARQSMGDVIARVNEVRYRLPEQAYDPRVERSAGESVAVAYVGFTTDTLTIPQLNDYLSRVVEPSFSSVEGVAKVQSFGSQQLAMRVWIDTDKLAARKLTAADVAEAIRANNYQAAAGDVQGQYVMAQVRVNTDLHSLEEFQRLVVADRPDGLVRLRDVATVELGPASRQTSATMDGKPAIHLGMFATPSGNPLNIVADLRAQLEQIKKTLPPGVQVALAFETARFIQASIDEVMTTLTEAVLIVVLVIFLCLGSLRSVMIPVIAIPLSLLGAAGLMLVFGFSINLLTLLAMVLAIGLVVDDAIVVVENVYRHIEEGKSPMLAAVLGAREVAGPVVAMTLTLAAVYMPIGLMGGLTGALFKEFALTLAGAVLVSGIIALSLSPVMSAFFLPKKQQAQGLSAKAEQFFQALSHRYAQALHASLRHSYLSAGLALLVFLALPFLYIQAQKELAPIEDQAAILTAIKSPQHVSLNYVEHYAQDLHASMMDQPEAVGTWIINGTDGVAQSFGGVNLSLWEQRDRSANQIQQSLQQALGKIEGSQIFAFQLPPLPGAGGGLPVQMVLRTALDYADLYDTMESVKQAARESGLFAVVDSDLDYTGSALEVRVDREKANELGISMRDIAQSLSVFVGEAYVNRFALEGRSYDVIPQAKPEQISHGQSLARHQLKTKNGDLIPMSVVVSIQPVVEPNSLTQFAQQNAATLQAILAPGASMGEAVAYLETLAQSLPADYHYDWLSESRQYVHEGNALLWAFLAALLVIYLVLAAQYDSLLDPFIILITVPLSMAGALLPLALGWASLNIYTQIGLVTLIGLISKHGILMVEFANELHYKQGVERLEAMIQAARLRLRPVLMTTAAMAFGVVPLLFASGAGAQSRFGLGLVIVCGMLVGTVFTLFVLPTFYVWADFSAARRHARALAWQELEQQLEVEQLKGHEHG